MAKIQDKTNKRGSIYWLKRLAWH